MVLAIVACAGGFSRKRILDKKPGILQVKSVAKTYYLRLFFGYLQPYTIEGICLLRYTF